MTHLLLIHAGPTPWDVEDRIVGNHPLPLTDLAKATIEGIVKNLTSPPSVVYRYRDNEASDQAAKLVAGAFKLRPRDAAGMDEVHLGLWQGLTRAELKFRFPTVFPEWEENPLAVNPPDGEPLATAIERLKAPLMRILRRNRGGTVALCVRPLAMQIILGLLRGEDHPKIAGHLHNISAVETMDMSTEAFQRFIA